MFVRGVGATLVLGVGLGWFVLQEPAAGTMQKWGARIALG